MRGDKDQFEGQEQFEEPSLEDFLIEEEVTKEEITRKKRKRFFFRVIGLFIAVILVAQVANSWFNLFSSDSRELARMSEEISSTADVEHLKEAVVTVIGNGGRGSGFAIHPEGYILTNHHVIHNRDPLAISFPNGELYEVDVLKSDEELDIALLKVKNKNKVDVPYLQIRFEGANQGERVYVIGNPLTQTQIVNEGTILNEEYPYQVVEISNSIFPGHSGSPVISGEEVVGVVYARSVPSSSDQESRGLAIPIESVLDKIPELIKLIESYN